MIKMKRHKIEHWNLISLLLVAYDIIAVTAAYFAALWFRFDCMVSAIDNVYIFFISNGFSN